MDAWVALMASSVRYQEQGISSSISCYVRPRLRLQVSRKEFQVLK